MSKDSVSSIPSGSDSLGGRSVLSLCFGDGAGSRPQASSTLALDTLTSRASACTSAIVVIWPPVLKTQVKARSSEPRVRCHVCASGSPSGEPSSALRCARQPQPARTLTTRLAITAATNEPQLTDSLRSARAEHRLICRYVMQVGDADAARVVVHSSCRRRPGAPFRSERTSSSAGNNYHQDVHAATTSSGGAATGLV